MKRLMLVAAVLMMLFSTVAEAGFSNSFWGAFAGSATANSLAQPQQPTVVVVQPQQSAPPQYPTNQPVPSIVGKVVAANWDGIVLKDQAGQIYSLRFYSASKNLTGKTITVSAELLAVSTTGALGDMIDTISYAPIQQQQQQQSNPVGADNGDVESRLKKAKSLREQDLITDEEYKTIRQKILNDL